MVHVMNNPDIQASEVANGAAAPKPANGNGESPNGTVGATNSDSPPKQVPTKTDASHDDVGSRAGEEIRNPCKVGDKDPSGGSIKNVFSSTRQFIIYEADNQVRVQLPDNYAAAKLLRTKITELGGLRASIEDLRTEPSLISSNESVRAARELSWALSLALEDESTPPSEKPKEILTRVDARLRNLVKSHYRKKYVLANLAAFAGIEIILLLVAFAFGYVWKPDGNMAALHRYAIYASFGGLGAFLSVITGIRSVDVDINLKKWEHIFAGSTRILIGVIGAVVVALALDSSFIDPTFGNSKADTTKGLSGLDRQLALSLIFAFIGGFSESFVPNLLRRGEQAAGASDRQNTVSDPIVKDMKP
jgi:hypothetical protein